MLITTSILKRIEGTAPEEAFQTLQKIPAIVEYLQKFELYKGAMTKLLYIIGITIQAFLLTGRKPKILSLAVIETFQNEMTDTQGYFIGMEFLENIEPEMWHSFCSFTANCSQNREILRAEVKVFGIVYGSVLSSLVVTFYDQSDYSQIRYFPEYMEQFAQTPADRKDLQQMTFF